MADQQKLISGLYLMAWLCDDMGNLMDPILPADLGIVVTWHLCHHHPPGSLWQTWLVNHGILLCWALMWPQSPCEEWFRAAQPRDHTCLTKGSVVWSSGKSRGKEGKPPSLTLNRARLLSQGFVFLRMKWDGWFLFSVSSIHWVLTNVWLCCPSSEGFR